MKIQQLLEAVDDVVLTKMATTINRDVSTHNQYTDRSCFGKVAHYLKKHRNPEWYIMLFGAGVNREVTHCCLYDATGAAIIDTFGHGGSPQNVDGNVVYVDADGRHHPLLLSITVGNFCSQYGIK